METEIKTHKRKTKQPVDPGDLVSEKSLQKNYKIIGKVSGMASNYSIFVRAKQMICAGRGAGAAAGEGEKEQGGGGRWGSIPLLPARRTGQLLGAA